VRRQRRDGAIRVTFAASLTLRGVSAFCSIAQVPLALAWLGAEAFGLWAALASITLLLTAFDFGLGAAMQNEVAQTLGRDRPQRAAALFCSAFLALLVIGGVLLAAGFGLAGLMDWGRLFHLTSPTLATEAVGAVKAAFVLFAIGLPLATAQRLAHACQWGWLAALWNVTGAIGQLAIVAAAGHFRLPFATFVLLTGLPALLANAGLLVHLALRLRWRLADLGLATPTERLSLWHRSWDFCLLQVSAAFLFNAPAPLIGLVAGAPAVTAFNVVQRLFGLFAQLQQMVLAPLWPAYTEAQARHDYDWIETIYRRSFTGTLLGICLPLVVAACAMRGIVDLWTGRESVDLPAGLVWLLCAWNVLLAISGPPAYLLNGLGRMRRLGWITLAGSVLITFAMLALGRRAGAAGVVGALAGGYLLILLPATLLESRRALRSLRTGPPTSARTLLPGFVRAAIVRRLCGPPRGGHARRFVLGIYKVDRLGDFVLALGAIRTLLDHYGAERCLLVVSTAAESVAAAEFPTTPRLVLPVSAGGVMRELWPAARRHRPRFAEVACDTIICLRHQRERYHEVSLSWLQGDRCLILAPGDQPPRGFLPSSELEAHRRLLSSALGRVCTPAEVLPRFTAVSPAAATGLLLCPFSSDPTRDIPADVLLGALQAWARDHPGPVVLSGAPADVRRLADLQARARALGVSEVSVQTPPDPLGFIRLVLDAGTVLSADSAGAHIAAAGDKPLVVVQGGAFAGVFGPWQRSARQVWLQHPLPCFGCASHCTEPENYCLTRLPASRIVAALEEVSR